MSTPTPRTFEQQLALDFPPLVGRSAFLPPEALVPRPTPSSVELAFAEVAEAFRPVVDRYVAAFGIIRDSVLEHAARLRLEAEWGPRRTYDHEPWTPPVLLADDPVPARHSSVAGLASFGGVR